MKTYSVSLEEVEGWISNIDNASVAKWLKGHGPGEKRTDRVFAILLNGHTEYRSAYIVNRDRDVAAWTLCPHQDVDISDDYFDLEMTKFMQAQPQLWEKYAYGSAERIECALDYGFLSQFKERFQSELLASVRELTNDGEVELEYIDHSRWL